MALLATVDNEYDTVNAETVHKSLRNGSASVTGVVNPLDLG